MMTNDPIAFSNEAAKQLGLLFKFARKVNELDFAWSLTGEFRGAQDAGWSTTTTAVEVARELESRLNAGPVNNYADLRIILLLYCQLSEAGGVYEGLKNMMGIFENTAYNLWPFRDLVRVKSNPKKVIGPNANATFRDLAEHARRIGFSGLSIVCESVFHDDIRNGMYHSDYVLGSDGLRLRRRNGGHPLIIPYQEALDIVSVGLHFFRSVTELSNLSIQTFEPPREVVGRASLNPPMRWTVGYDPASKTFSMSSSSPGIETTPEYARQEAINEYLSGRVMVVFRDGKLGGTTDLDFSMHGLEPTEIDLPKEQFGNLLEDVSNRELWDDRHQRAQASELLALTPWGFRFLENEAALAEIIGDPEPALSFEPQHERSE